MEKTGRNLFGGYDQWAKDFPLLNTIMHFLQWFTVPIEVLLRRDFGERWLTGINFFIGLVVLFWYNLMQQAGSSFLAGVTWMLNRQSYDQEPTFFQRLMGNSMFYILLLYLGLGAYHFFKMWWRNRTNTPLHSFDDGISRLEPLAAGVMDLVNAISKPVIRLFINLLPQKEKDKNKGEIPPLYNNVTAFTDTFFEPLFLFLLAIVMAVLGGGTMAIWLFLSSIAVFIFASWKHTARLNKLLDMRDNMIDSTEWQSVMKGEVSGRITPAQKEIVEQIVEKVKEAPAAAQKVKDDYPDFMDIIQEMNAMKSKG